VDRPGGSCRWWAGLGLAALAASAAGATGAGALAAAAPAPSCGGGGAAARKLRAQGVRQLPAATVHHEHIHLVVLCCADEARVGHRDDLGVCVEKVGWGVMALYSSSTGGSLCCVLGGASRGVGVGGAVGGSSLQGGAPGRRMHDAVLREGAAEGS